jgi:hypothetical protein
MIRRIQRHHRYRSSCCGPYYPSSATDGNRSKHRRARGRGVRRAAAPASASSYIYMAGLGWAAVAWDGIPLGRWDTTHTPNTTTGQQRRFRAHRPRGRLARQPGLLYCAVRHTRGSLPNCAMPPATVARVYIYIYMCVSGPPRTYTLRMFGLKLLKFNSHHINVPLNVCSIKYRLIAYILAQIRSNLRDESIKLN